MPFLFTEAAKFLRSFLPCVQKPACRYQGRERQDVSVPSHHQQHEARLSTAPRTPSLLPARLLREPLPALFSSALLLRWARAGCRSTALLHREHPQLGVMHKAPHGGVFPFSIYKVAERFANIFPGQEALSLPQALPSLPPSCQIAAL